MTARGNGSLEVLVPRGLLGSGLNFVGIPVSSEGLVAARIGWDKGCINSIEALSVVSDSRLKMLLPRFIEPHAHLDKAFSWNNHPNLAGTYKGALDKNLQELRKRKIKDVTSRAERALGLAFKNGIRAIRTHIDSFEENVESLWESLFDLKSQWKTLIELQFVALVPLEYWSTSEGNSLAQKISSKDGLLGTAIVPPFDENKTYDLILEMLKLANRYNCGIDLHIDESQNYPAAGLKQLLRVLDNIENQVPITCSHVSSISLLQAKELMILSDKLAKHKIQVVALPLTNFWLLGRSQNKTLTKRPCAPIYELQKAGVNISVGGDNVQDPWFPCGNFDPLSLMGVSMLLTHLAPWDRLGLAPFTNAPATLMGIQDEGLLEIGNSADFMLLDATSWTEALSSYCPRKIFIEGEFIDKDNILIANIFKESV